MNRKYLSLVMAAASVLRDDVVGTDGAAAASNNANVELQKSKFHFKKEKIKDAEGKEVGEGVKLPTAELNLPIPTKGYLVQILQGGEEYAKDLELLLQAVSDVVYVQARAQINAWREDNPGKPITEEVLNFKKLDWHEIAITPKAERGSSVPGEDDIKAFLDSYVEIMPAATGKPVEKIKNHVTIFAAGFKKQRGQKAFLEVFKSALQVYVETAPAEVLDDNKEVVEYFDNRLTRMINSEEKITLDDI